MLLLYVGLVADVRYETHNSGLGLLVANVNHVAFSVSFVIG